MQLSTFILKFLVCTAIISIFCVLGRSRAGADQKPALSTKNRNCYSIYIVFQELLENKYILTLIRLH